MTPLRILSSLMALAFCSSCISLSYPREVDQQSGASTGPASAAMAELLGDEEVALSWSDLTRLAREHQQKGELTEAGERLEQAALQVAMLPATHTRRRTVFGLRARLSIKMAKRGDLEAADELADELLAEAEGEPKVGGAALVTLALSVADRRPQESRLPLLRIALTTAQSGATSRERMNLSRLVAEEAYREMDFELARRAIDQAVTDAKLTAPSKKGQIATLEIFRSQIALEQGDIETAESSAIRANQLFNEISANSSDRGIAEATLSEVLAEKGDVDRALVIARGAYARIGSDETIEPHAERVILVAFARVKRSVGDFGSARHHYERALKIPGLDTPADTALVEQVTAEVRELDERATSSSPESPPN